MSIVPLVKLTLVGHEKQKDEVLAELQELGLLHLIPLTHEGERADELGASRQARDALQFLASAPAQRRQVRDAARFDPVAVEKRALELQQRLQELKTERGILQLRSEALAPWGDFEFPSVEELGGWRFWFYAVPHHRMSEVEASPVRWEVVDRDHRHCYVVVVSEFEPESDAMPVPRTRTGARSRRQLEERLEQVEEEIEDCEAERTSLTRWCRVFARALDGLDDRAARVRAADQTARAAPVYALQAWAPRESLAVLRQYAATRGLALEVAEPDSDEQPPTRLDNPAPLRSGEDLVEFYMTPSYRIWDPSSIVFFSFALFFAMILADTGYALVLAAITGIFWRRMGRSDVGRRWRILLAVLSGATAVYGVLVGSTFGVRPPAGSFLARLNVLDLGSFSTMMNVSIVIGALHIAYANVRNAWRHERFALRIAPLGWAAVVIGGLLAWEGLQIEAQSLVRGGAALGAFGLVGVVGFAGMGRPPLARAFQGLSALTQLSSAFGDVLSYLRLFALGLASSSLALAFNDMAGDVREAIPGVGLLFAALVLLVGHALNFTLSLSSGFIHGLRLNVIEFFKWGVTDEGTSYRPFARKEATPWTTSS